MDLEKATTDSESLDARGFSLSYGQRALWFLDRLALGNTAYIIAGAARVLVPLDTDGIAALRRAATALAARHPALRATFDDTPEGPVGRLGEEPRVDFVVEDAAALAGPALARRLVEIAFRPFDLARGPLLRIGLVASAEGQALTVSVHHIVADFWSLGVLLRDLGALYGRELGLKEGVALPPPPAIGPGEAARREAASLAGARGEELLAFWRQALAETPLVLELPVDHPRPTTQGFRGASRSVRLAPGPTDALKRLARRQGATLYMALLTAFEVLLSRYTGQEKLVVGCPTTRRSDPELAGLVGYLVNPVSIPGDVGGDPSGAELLERVRRAALASFAHQDYPLPLLAERLQPERDPGRSPLFQTVLVLQKGRKAHEAGLAALAVGEAGVPFDLGPLGLESLALEGPGVQFDLQVGLADTARGLAGRWLYDRHLFETATMERMAGHFTNLLAALAAGGEPGFAQAVSELPLLATAERQQILVEWNEPRLLYPQEGLLPDLVAARAESQPDHVVVAWREGGLTYGELTARSHRLARHLILRGIGPERLVGVAALRSPEMIVALLGILETGAAYLPLDPALPAERLAFMLADSGARLVLASASLAPRLPGTCEILYLDRDAAAWTGESAVPPTLPDAPRVTIDPDTAAYVIYTSGSTGQPKGVVITHRSAANRLRFHAATDLAEPVALLHKTTISFDVSVLEIFGPLLSGGRMVLARPGGQQDVPYLVRLLAEQQIGHLTFPPSMLALLLEEEEFRACRTLRTVVTGSETVPPELAARFGEHLTADLWNRYGPTEATVAATAWRCRPEARERSLPIGRPIAGAEVLVLDRDLHPVPIGVAGEIAIGGVGLARGYLGRPALTAEKFVPHLHSGRLGARLYRTGDLGRFRPDGALEFLGRRDGQVKVRGFRIELGEIESALAAGPGVREAVVLARDEDRGGRRLVAYVAGEGLDPAALAAQLAARLPGYMVPSAFALLPALPLSPNGKVDRRTLAGIAPQPLSQGREEDEEAGGAGPRSAVEEVVAAVWAEVLGVERIGVRDDFFRLGGHSLLATQVLSRLRRAFGVEIPLRKLFEGPTVRALALAVETARRATTGELPLLPRPRSRRPDGRVEMAPSFAQERMWFLDQWQPGSALYNLPGAVRLSGPLDAGALAAGLARLVLRHEALRTTFALAEGGESGPVQVIAPASRVALPRVDLASLPAERAASERERLGHAEARRPFDLVAGPLLRATLLRSAAVEHLLLLTLHHSVGDGWSIGVLVRDLAAFYRQHQGLASPLPELEIQYADFAAWQREWLAGEVLAAQLAYWRQRLAGAPERLELTADRPRPAVQSFRGESLPVALGEPLAAGLAALARRQGATPFMVLLAAFDALLGRYTGALDLTVGSPVANRTHRELEGLIGLFVNTVVLRADLSGDPSFESLLDRTREATLGAYAHQDLPFERLVEELAAGRSLAHAPLFQVVLALQNTPAAGLSLPGIAVERRAYGNGTAKFDLLLSCEETGAGFGGYLEYSADLFDRATAERLLGHFATLLAGALAAPASRLSDLPLLAPEERSQLLTEWAGAASPYPRESTIQALFAEQAARVPEAVALVAGEDQLTYGELAVRAAHLTGVLAALGVGPEVAVALALPRSPGLVVALLAVLGAGGAYLPLDPSYPEERLVFMLEEGRAQLLLAAPEVAERLPAAVREGQVVLLGTDGRPSPGQGLPAPRPPRGEEIGAESLAYVMFTSGSTGRPKGVAVVHRGVVRLVRGADYARFGPEEVFLQLAPASFDAATLEIWGALLNGGRLVLMPPETPTFKDLGEALARHGVTTLWLTAGLFHQMVEENLAGLAPVRQLLAGGDALSPAHVVRAAKELPGTRLIDGYGPTEGTTFTCCWPVAAERLASLAAGGPVPIGRPIANTRVFVLDRDDRLAPVGVPGELAVGGDGLARGYVNRPDLTADRFRPDPFGGAGGRLYLTGDLVRWRASQEIEFLGRIDRQVKIRGFRIEPGEVEAVLSSHPEVGQAAVLVREDRPGDRRLVAYAAARPGAALAPATASAELRSYLKERLPDYMVPAACVLLDALPLTPNGKVDRRALAAIVPEGSGKPGPPVAPRTSTEDLLAGIWADLLGVEQVRVDDNFFDLGGHSLLATRVVSRVSRELGAELPVRALFESPTVAALAARIAAALPAAPSGPLRVARDAGPPWRLPLSFAQERLWFLDRLEPGSAVYNIPAALCLSGALKIPALAAAFTSVVCRHEALRTSFVEGEEGALQEIAAPSPVALPLADLSALPGARREAAAFSHALAAARRPFDLTRGPLLRVTLLRLGESDHRLVFAVHHIVADGWSMGVLVRELGEVYGALLAGRAPHLPELPVQYADYAVWQRQWLAGAVLAEQLDWWREKLAGVPGVLELPGDRPRPPVQAQTGGSLAVRLPAGLLARLAALGRAREASPFMVLLAGFGALLSRHAGQEKLVVGAPVANRTRREVEDLVGFFVNTLALPVDVGDDPPLAALLAQVKETTLGAYAHQDLPFERLVEELAPERNLAHAPLFQVMLALENTGLRVPSLPGLDVEVVELPSGTEKFDLTLQLSEIAGGLAGALSYSRALFDRTTVERLWAHFLALLETAAREPERRVSELPLLAAGERQQLLEWGSTPPLAPLLAADGTTLARLFAAQAARTPAAEALVARELRWTYGELAARSARLARRLAALGAGPEERVAVCLPRSAGLVAALLGVLEAGAAYVPVDPAYPAERQGLMLADSRAAVVVTSAELLPSLPSGARAVLLLDPATGEPGELAGPGAEAVPRAAGPGNLAYLIYTSGSTGRPKAVAIEHRSAAGRVGWARQAFTDEELSGVLFATSVCFDLSVFELFGPLSWGGRVILAENALALPGLPAAGEVRLVNTVPSALAELVREGLLPRGVRTVNLAGEPLPRPLAEAIHGTGTVARLHNLYGPSEDTTYSTGSRVAPGAAGAPAIGRPLPGSRAHVLDRSGRPVPAGVAGELWLGGAGLARGYFGRPELTAERFVPDPFAAAGGERLYRTGDLARWRVSGELDFLGRVDHQVKVRGFRIELGEVEAALLVLPGVREAAVLALPEQPERPGDLRLVAYAAQVADAEELSASRVREALRARLPEHMVPASFVFLPSLPLSPNGKVDRKALARIAPERSAAGEHVAPRGPVETALAAIWEEVLGRPGIGAGDSFFDLGGHSLLATRLMSRVRRTFGVELPLKALFEAPTVAGLAERIAATRRTAESVPARLPRAFPRDGGPLPLSFAQERLWFLDRLEPGNPTYNVPAALRLTGPPSAAGLAPALSAALSAVVARHEALRTTFAAAGGRPFQVIGAPAPVPLPVVDLAALPAARREAAALALTRGDAERPFNLARGPLLRAALLGLAADRHLLVLNLHHIVTDGWSVDVLVREVAAVLAGRQAAGRLPELPLQYADYAVWQRGWLAGEVLAAQLAWWRERLAGMPPLLALPTDRPRPPVRGTAGGSVPVRLPAPLAESLTALGQSGKASLFMVLLAGFQALLARHAGQDRLVVGTPVANRTDREIEDLIGFFVNTLALPVDLADDPPFTALLERVRETALSAYAHQDLPFERLVEELAPDRGLAHTPLFQVVLVLQSWGVPTGLPGLAVEWVEIPAGTEKFDLTLNLREVSGDLRGVLSYRRDLFDRATVERLLGHFANLLTGALANPGGRISDLPLLSPAERAELLVEWSGGATAYPRESTVHALFAEQVARTPEAVALVAEGEHLSYGELATRAGLLAETLAACGVGPEVPVALLLPRSPALVVATLAVLAAGGAYLPLDPAAPAERLALLLTEGRAPVLLADPALAGPPANGGVQRVLLDGGGRPLPGQDLPRPAAPRGGEARAESLAYVMFTSGSTGKPKGVAVVHRGVVRLVRGTGYARFGPAEVFLQLAPASFDAATFEIWGALLNGGRLVLMPPEVPTLAELGRALARHGVTTLWLTAGLFHQMVEENLAGLASVRQLLAGGDALSPAHVARVARELPGTRLIDGYGPTEGTTFTCCWPVDVARLGMPAGPAAASVPIGRPIANTRIYVLDRRDHPTPVGVAGELAVGGDGLARGYSERPDLTADRFRPDPFGGAGAQGGRLYRTGDLVRFRPGGEIEFLGRIDRQVKIRGFRIEPGEIETVLASHPQLLQAAVLVREERTGERRLVAYAVARPGASPFLADLRSHLNSRLPEPMVPAAFVLLPALPLTANGKVDRGALAGVVDMADGEADGEAAAYVAPRTPVEERLAGLWTDLLGIERVGIEDDFFHLGGHSLLATRLVSRLYDAFGVELPLREVFAAPTIAALAGAIEAARAPVPLPSVRRPRPAELPLSFSQERLWFLDQLEPGSAAYNVPAVIRLRGRLRPELLAAALHEIGRRHEVLRTTFVRRGERPVQVIAAEPRIAVPEVDLSALPGARRQEEVRALAGAEARRPFDLAVGPLLRATLLQLTPGGALESPTPAEPPAEHLALLDLHHIVSDGWSMGVLIAELATLYGAFLAGRPSPLPELPWQYADFVLWQRELLAGPELARQLAWWRERLAGAPEALDLPIDRPRPAVQSFRGARQPFTLPASLKAALESRSQEAGTTLFMTLSAAFQALLARYSGQEDLTVGSPTAGRRRAEVEGLIGFFVNTLVLRLSLSGRPAFRELLARVREFTLGAYEHQDLPFERLVEELRPERQLARSPLFQVMFVLQNAPAAALSLPGLELQAIPVESGIAKFELTLALREEAGEEGRSLAGLLEYNRDLFDPPTAARLTAHFTTLLEAALAAPDLPFAELPLLGPGERHQVFSEWNDRAEDYPRDGLVHVLIAARAALEPLAPAVGLGAERLSYGELEARAARIARHLLAHGAGPDHLVGIAVERSFAMVAALLGIWKAGAAYLPLDAALPAERLAFMLADAGVGIVLTQASLLPALPDFTGTALSVDDLWETEPEGALPLSDFPELPERAAYVIYTSGSTGQPKGVVISHGALGNRLRFAQGIELAPGDSFVQKTTTSFDASVSEIWSPLLAGGTTVLARPGGERDPAYLVELVREWRIPHMSFTMAMLATLLDEQSLAGCDSLRTVLAGGEVLPPDLPPRFHAQSRADIFNRYGPTETTISVTSWRCERGWEGRTVPIGRPIARTEIYVLDRELQPLPVGIVGELCIGGIALARGYLKRPEATAERFVPHPFSRLPGARLYRSGDLARFRPDGVLEFVGRTDSQVKIRGFRVELGEIEAALAEHPGLDKTAVVDRADPATGSRRLVAYFVPRPEVPLGDVTPRALQEFLGSKVPGYMVPSAFVRLDALPLTPTGKTDRQALPEPESGQEESGETPQTPIEELLAGIWMELLDVSRVGRGESFFELGGHSLLATRLVSRLRETLGVELPLKSVFEAPTLSGMADLVAAARLQGGIPAAPPIRPLPRTRDLPLSFAQERLWFLEQLDPGSTAYNLPAAVRFTGRLGVPALAGALAAIVARHETLRTRFAAVEGRPVQAIAQVSAFAMPLIDLAALPAAAREGAARLLTRAHARRPFDLAAGSLVRAALLRLGTEEHLVLLCFHHIVSDGWSMGVLVRELGALYAGDSLPALPVQYADFAVWQREWLAGEVLAAEISWWREQLAGAPAVLALPADRPRPAVQRFRGGSVPFVLPADVTAGLFRLCRRRGVTPFMALLAGLDVLLWRGSGQEDLVVGSPVANRTRREVEGLIGFFVNSLALRADLSGEPAFAELLARVREQTLGAYAHQDLPFEKLVEALAPERSLAHAPLFQVFLVLQNTPAGKLCLPGLEIAPVAGETGAAKFDLTLALGANSAGELAGVWEYDRDLFDPSTVVRLGAQLARLLAAAVSEPETEIGALSLLSAAERQQLAEWNGTAASYPERSLAALLAEPAARTPDAVAVVFADESLSHGELAARARRLAGELRRLGVGPEVRVGICAERSLALLVGLAAILAAGGAYVPLDPSYPAERLAFMLEDSGVPVLLAESRLAAALPPHGATVVPLDAPLPAFTERPPLRQPEIGPDHLAYVIYTSGSTGRPKGAMNTHRGIVNRLLWMQERYGLTAADRVLQKTPVSFDVSVWELFWPLTSGACLVVARPGGHQDPLYLVETIARQEVTFLHFVPAMLSAFLEAPDLERCVALRQVVASGEALPYDLERRFFARLGRLGTRLENLYGPTEAAVDVTFWPCDPAGEAGRVPIGRPVANTAIHVLGRDLRPLPPGAAGELAIGGVQVARGYLGRPELTAERFLPDPFSGLPGARLYRTGDLARHLPDGAVEYLGRIDHQVKLRGFRIELGEIESALLGHPRVRDAVVVVREDPPAGARLVAYVVAEGRDGAELPALLPAWLGLSLPSHMVPAAVVVLPALPLNPSGKVDRKALPAPDWRAGASFVALRTPLEEVLAGFFADALGLERAGVEDSFFRLGGHSLLATQLVAKIRGAFQVELPLRRLFETPTVAALAAAILAAEARPGQSERIARVLLRVRRMAEEKQLAVAGEEA